MTTRRARISSLAKINLDLRVLYRRNDGFHELRTIFQTISLGDVLDIEHEPGRRFSVELDSDPPIPDNLIVRAARLLHERARVSGAWRFSLKKRTPMGAGLGGGSSNAAAALLSIPVLAGKPAPLGMLAGLAAELGSDVPFFLLGGTAAAIGRGTELYPLPDIPPVCGILVTPGIHVSTPEAYRSLARPAVEELTSGGASSILNSFQSLAWRAEECAKSPEWAARNDFEGAVFRKYPKLRQIRDALRASGAHPALMSGSGSSIFGLFPARNRREAALREFRKRLGEEQVHAITFVSRSGYRSLWRRQLKQHIQPRRETRSLTWPPQSRYSR
jgi:4-diphosphocytidyl-2-C-methyl-D-erythritol kinase